MATKMDLKGCMKLLEKMSVLILNEIAASNYSSLLNDFVESELFLIDGDSLFITCLNDEKLKAGQNLHFFYLVERYLLDLRSKGGQFIVVFFKDFEHSYFETPELLPLRTALILHLQKNTDINIQSEFSGCFSQEWNCFLEENCPYFLLVSDEGMTSLQTYLFYFYIIHSWSMKISTALISGQKLDILRVHAYFMLSRHKNQNFFKQEKNQMKGVYQTLIEHLKTSSAAALTPLFDQLHCNSWEKEICWSIGQLQALWPKGSDIQRVLCVLSCSLSLKMYQNFLEKEKKTSPAIDTSEKHLASVEEVKDLCRMYCLSVVFLLHLPLSQRACTRLISSSWKNSVSTFLKMKKWCEFFVLKNLHSSETWNVDLTHVCDTNDDQLWKNIVYYYEKESTQGLHLELGKAIEEDYKDLWSAVSHLVREFDVGPPLPLRVTMQLFLQNTCSPIKEETQEKMPNLGFIPMTSPIVKKFAGDILDQVPFLSSDDPVVTSLVKYKEFHELVHWHSHKPLSDHYERTKSFTDGKSPYFLKSIQKLQTFQQHFGNSLEGTTSKIIVTQSVQPKKDFVAAKKNKKSHESKADIIIKENNNRLLAKEEQKESERWKTLSSSIEGEMKENFHSGITKLEDFLKSCKSNSVKFSVEMIGLNASLNAWREHCQGEGRVRKDFNIAIHMMKRIHSIMDKYQEFLQESDKKKISRCLKYLGFDNLARTLDPTQVMEKDKNSKKVHYALDMGPARFQLQHMGHYLFRDERKDPDPRVKDFIPDTWQRELLDVVDNNESAVIVAPTSSGKTYASYYCMEKVLRESDDGVIVYVAPTKALVNQVSTTVQSLFTKHLPEGQVLCGVFTRDYRHYALNCQVLITVPACFEILLLSPNRQEWVEKIRYVIFDEVHCLGGQIGAEIWEHLLVMIRCPFLALSATINNPEHLTEWLQSVKRYWQEAEKSIDDFHPTLDARRVRASQRHLKAKKSYKVRLVLYEERYNDLEKYVCSLQDGDISFDHYHPCATLTTDHIEKYGFPSDLALSPRESIQLYDIMVQVWKTWPKAQELCPEEFVYFKNKIVITKMDAKKYETALKEEISNWIKNGNVIQAKQVLKILRPAPVNQSDYMNHIFPLLVEKLRKMDKLPALFFMFKISVVEEKAREVCQDLEEKQERRQSAKAIKEIHVLTNKLKKVKKSMEKTPTVPENALKRSSRMDQSIVREAEHVSLLKMLEKKIEIPPDCTYANPKMIDEETLQMLFDRIKSQRKGKELTQLSRRGIGYHHGALNARERQFIEVLFRKGFLRVVTATSTLALGINMPCKSVVFTQNSIYLDALNYRQMSGRAGRRGQDFLGNVFFYNIPLPKIEKLIKSNVPELKGQFPFGMSLVLRLMLLASKADNIPDANAKVLSVLTHSLLSFKNPRIQEMLKLYFLFSMQFLVKEGYLDCEGNPIGFAGLVSHLFYQEPSNLLFVSFLKKGLFHNLCQPTKKGSKYFSQDVMEKLTLVLANLFGRMHIPAKLLDGNLKFYQSKVFLEDFPTDFDAALLEYNTNVIRDFSQFLLIVSKFADMKQEYQLPLSKIDFTGKRGATSKLAAHLMSCKESRSAVSPFVCLSGVTNQDLLQGKNIDSIILRTIGVTSSQAPVLYSKKVDSLGRTLPLNAYVLDFYKHGSLKGIEQDNRITEGEAYMLLKDFSLILQSISVSLRELCEDETDDVVLAFEQLSKSFKEKLDKV